MKIYVHGYGEWGIQAYDEPYIEIYSHTDELLKKLELGGYPAREGNWEIREVEYTISLDNVQTDCSFWVKYGNDKKLDYWCVERRKLK